MLRRGILACSADWSNSLMASSVASLLWPWLFLVVVTMSFSVKHPGRADLRVKLLTVNGVL